MIKNRIYLNKSSSFFGENAYIEERGKGVWQLVCGPNIKISTPYDQEGDISVVTLSNRYVIGVGDYIEKLGPIRRITRVVDDYFFYIDKK